MFLQILPPDNIATVESMFENQLGLVILGLSISVFTILKITKLLSKIKINKTSNKSILTS